MPRHGVWGDSLQFIFDGGRMSPEQAAGLTLQESELRSWRFVTPDEAVTLTPPSLARRLQAALSAVDQGQGEYLRYGRRSRHTS